MSISTICHTSLALHPFLVVKCGPSVSGCNADSRTADLVLLLLDNYDSFVYNLYQYLSELGADVRVYRNDRITLGDIERMSPERIVISPGPCTPLEAGISNDVIRRFATSIPILGVCLGHQCIGYVYGGKVVRAPEIVHGKTSPVHHNDEGLFAGLPNPMQATRYHSLMVAREGFPQCLEITAWTDNGIIMALRHKEHPVVGVQFHPEAILTTHGKDLLRNFLNYGGAYG